MATQYYFDFAGSLTPWDYYHFGAGSPTSVEVAKTDPSYVGGTAVLGGVTGSTSITVQTLYWNSTPFGALSTSVGIYESLIKAKVGGLPSAQAFASGVVSVPYYNDGNYAYGAGVNQSGALQCLRLANSLTATVGASKSIPSYDFTKFQFIRCRVEIKSPSNTSTIQAKIWQDGVTEPSWVEGSGTGWAVTALTVFSPAGTLTFQGSGVGQIGSTGATGTGAKSALLTMAPDSGAFLVDWYSFADEGVAAAKPPKYVEVDATERGDTTDVNIKRQMSFDIDVAERGDGGFYAGTDVQTAIILRTSTSQVKLFAPQEGRDSSNIDITKRITLPSSTVALPSLIGASGNFIDGFRLVKTALPNTLRSSGLINEQFHGTASLPSTLAILSDIIVRPTLSGSVTLPFTLQSDSLVYVVSSITSTGVDAFEIVLTGSMVQGSTQVISPTADVDYPFIDGNTYLVVNLRTKSHTTYKDGSNDALAKTGLLTFGTNQMKNISDAYLLSRSTTDVEFITKNDEITERNYAVTYADYGQFNLSNKKIRLAKGLRGQEWQISIVSLGNDYAEVREIEMIVNQLQRRI